MFRFEGFRYWWSDGTTGVLPVVFARYANPDVSFGATEHILAIPVLRSHPTAQRSPPWLAASASRSLMAIEFGRASPLPSERPIMPFAWLPRTTTKAR